MSDEEHHLESKADTGESKTYPRQPESISSKGYIVINNRPCKVPHVNRTDYKLIGISEDGGFASLLNENGGTKDDVRLPTDDSLRTLIKDGFAVGKDLVLSVWSAMGEEQIYKVKKIDSKVCARKRSRRESLSAMGEEQICAVMEIGPKLKR